MGLTKVKSKKQKKRLALRIAEYEKNPVNPYTRQKYTKPGSNNK